MMCAIIVSNILIYIGNAKAPRHIIYVLETSKFQGFDGRYVKRVSDVKEYTRIQVVIPTTVIGGMIGTIGVSNIHTRRGATWKVGFPVGQHNARIPAVFASSTTTAESLTLCTVLSGP